MVVPWALTTGVTRRKKAYGSLNCCALLPTWRTRTRRRCCSAKALPGHCRACAGALLLPRGRAFPIHAVPRHSVEHNIFLPSVQRLVGCGRLAAWVAGGILLPFSTCAPVSYWPFLYGPQVRLPLAPIWRRGLFMAATSSRNARIVPPRSLPRSLGRATAAWAEAGRGCLPLLPALPYARNNCCALPA